MDILTEILKIGGPTVAIVVILFLTIKEFLKIINELMTLVTNHINHNTEVLKEVSERTKQDTVATKENTTVLQSLEKTLIKVNGNKK